MLSAENVAQPDAPRCILRPQPPWVRVGQNAAMVAWAKYALRTCPYPLTAMLERFHTPQGLQHAILLRSHPTPNLRAWFGEYNARQTVEAGRRLIAPRTALGATTR